MPGPDQNDIAHPTPICAIGASAGGLAALQKFFAAIPNDLGLAYVVVVHLSPDHPSQLGDLLAVHTDMPVEQVEDAPKLRPNCVYVIAPDRELTIEGDNVAARPITEPRSRRAPIDLFFRSVAAGRGDGLAVVLSGAGSDGALGVRAIKEAGGVIFAQEPREADYPMMPRSAIATGVVDFVAPVRELVERVGEVVHSKRELRDLRAEDADHDLRQIIGLLRARTGHDFAHYKRSTILRRVARRMQVARQDSLAGYGQYLRTNPEEAQQLFQDLLISVTMFFRNHGAFDALLDKAVRPLFDRLVDGEGIRVWVVGCATGEEAYSLAMVLLEEAARRKVQPQIQIFASDLDEGALATAREGRYPKTIEADVSDERLRRFFVEDGAHYRVRKEVRELLLFAAHSALKDPPFIRIDLAACRNLLIYLDRHLQRQLCGILHYALKPHGYLLLGSAESTDTAPELFSTVDREARIFMANPLAERAAPILPEVIVARQGSLPPISHPPRVESPAALANLHASALERQSPPSVLVDEGHRVLHLSPNAGRFLLPSEGAFSIELPQLVRPELRLDLKLALQRAFEQRESTLTLPASVAFNGASRRVLMHVSRSEGDHSAPQALVLFLDGGTPASAAPTAERSGDAGATEETRRLRGELAVTQERLSASRNEYEQAIQDLRAANEELQSINEEYRSTAEELETSKEELQSINEELQTVNAELKNKFEGISSAHNDLQNLMAATEIGTLFLDREMRIKLFTPPIASHFNITEADIGRAITNFTHRLDYVGLEQDAKGVLSSLMPMEKEMRTTNDRWLMMRLRPYRTLDNRIEGVVVTFTDITGRKEAEEALAKELRAPMVRLQRLNPSGFETDNLTAPLEAVLDAAMDLLGADFGNVQLYDSASKKLRIAVQRNFEQPFLDHFREVDAQSGSACGMALAKGQQVAIEDVEKEPAFQPSLAAARAAGYRAVQSAPLLGSSGPVGMLSVQFREPRHFSEHNIRLLDICARYAADAITTYQLQEALRRSEKRLRQVLETDAVGVILFDAMGTIIDANPAFLQMTGHARSEIEARKLTWRGMTPPEWISQLETALRELEETGFISPHERELQCKDGSRKWMLIAGRKLDDGTVARYCIDTTARKLVEKERELLAHELSHRVKNTLAVVQSLALNSAGGAKSVEEYRDAFLGRLRALARAHGVLLDADWRGADIKELVAQATEPYRGSRADGIAVSGPPVDLSPTQSLVLSLALHELGANAAKYGALSHPEGCLRISWLVEGNDSGRRLRLTWQERNGPTVVQPATRGFGTEMIEQACAYELSGDAKLDFAPEGLTCTITFPTA
jgi:two-component system CheB/CheR fusion protein